MRKVANNQFFEACQGDCPNLRICDGCRDCQISHVNPATKELSLDLFGTSLILGTQIVCDFNAFAGDNLKDMDAVETDKTEETAEAAEATEGDVSVEEDEEQDFDTDDEAIEYLMENEVNARIEKAEIQLGTWNGGVIMIMAKWSVLMFRFAKKAVENDKVSMRDCIKFCIKEGLYIPATKRKIETVKEMLHKFRKEKDWPKRVRLKEEEIDS